jgi:hypothetical protein
VTATGWYVVLAVACVAVPLIVGACIAAGSPDEPFIPKSWTPVADDLTDVEMTAVVDKNREEWAS